MVTDKIVVCQNMVFLKFYYIPAAMSLSRDESAYTGLLLIYFEYCN